MTGILLLIWAAGLRDAILGGLQLGYVRHDIIHPYPLKPVLWTCGIITGETALLFAILRPFSFAKPGRAWVALAVFGTLWIADFILVSSWTDQPGYRYSNGFFLLVAVGFLIVASALNLLIIRRRPDLRINDPPV